jgi:hypothetical protein
MAATFSSVTAQTCNRRETFVQMCRGKTSGRCGSDVAERCRIERRRLSMYSRPEGFSSPLVDASSPVAGAGASSSLTYEPFYGLREKPFSLSRSTSSSPASAAAKD